jgi:hypothetical protein
VLKIHEHTSETGELASVSLRCTDDAALELVTAETSLRLPFRALEGVLSRYGAPFDASANITMVAELPLPDGRKLRHVRHLAGYDVVPRDYLVLEMPEGEPLCVHGAAVVGPLLHLARAAARGSAPAR